MEGEGVHRADTTGRRELSPPPAAEYDGENDDDDASEDNELRRRAELEFAASAYSGDDELWITWEGADNDGDIEGIDDDNTGGRRTSAAQPGRSRIPRVHRRLVLRCDGTTPSGGPEHTRGVTECAVLALILELTLPLRYPSHAPLRVQQVKVEEIEMTDSSSSLVSKWKNRAYDVYVPTLAKLCQDVANDLSGCEASFAALQAADDWIADVNEQDWGDDGDDDADGTAIGASATATAPTKIAFGRKLIYSHHIISKKKRAEIRKLAAELQLTGCMKVGWPGLIIVEGLESNCCEFYDTIKRWQWQYLVLRGEMRDYVDCDVGNGVVVERGYRKFQDFVEIEDMSVVADRCRQVGLEDLFRTSMKQYSDSDIDNHNDNGDEQLFGALAHIDHFNDTKRYHKWLCKTSDQFGDSIIGLLVKHCYDNNNDVAATGSVDDNEGMGKEMKNNSSTCQRQRKPIIVVGLVGTSMEAVSDFLKKWRTSRGVDVDSTGKPCYERHMTALVQGQFLLEEEEGEVDSDGCGGGVDNVGGNEDRRKRLGTCERRRIRSWKRIDWGELRSYQHLEISKSQLLAVVESIGGKTWVDVLQDSVLQKRRLDTSN